MLDMRKQAIITNCDDISAKLALIKPHAWSRAVACHAGAYELVVQTACLQPRPSFVVRTSLYLTLSSKTGASRVPFGEAPVAIFSFSFLFCITLLLFSSIVHQTIHTLRFSPPSSCLATVDSLTARRTANIAVQFVGMLDLAPSASDDLGG